MYKHFVNHIKDFLKDYKSSTINVDNKIEFMIDFCKTYSYIFDDAFMESIRQLEKEKKAIPMFIKIKKVVINIISEECLKNFKLFKTKRMYYHIVKSNLEIGKDFCVINYICNPKKENYKILENTYSHLSKIEQECEYLYRYYEKLTEIT